MTDVTASEMGKRSWAKRKSPAELERLKAISKLPRPNRKKKAI